MYRYVKHILDILFAVLLLLLIWPLLLVLALVIRIDSPGTALFRQKRVGKDDHFFNIVKFRTMRTDAPRDMPTHLLSSADSHITRLGRFLRKSSLDELPQVFNILYGEMSFIGPRPALWNQDDLIACRQANGANTIRPGLTGWAQVNGRDELPILRKAELDGYYAANCSLSLDLRILIRTGFKVFRADGVIEGEKKPGP
ncbi:MAG TPA: sugar transferase [Clostridia bacterium]